MADFNKAYAITMKAEGGYANDPDDKGGETYKGIARKANPNWNGWKTVDMIKATHPVSLNAALLSQAALQEQIKAFYQANYWEPNRTGDLLDQQLANQVFDTAVNSGTGTAAKFLQEAVGVTVDRQIGPQTLTAANKGNPKEIYEHFIRLRRQLYENIIAANPAQKKFQASWFSRLGTYEGIV